MDSVFARISSRLLMSYRLRSIPAQGTHPCRRHGLFLRLKVNRHVDREIAVTGTFERATTALFERVVGPGCRFLDVGANIGWYSLLAAQRVGAAGLVVAMEPTVLFRTDLEYHIARNGLGQRIKVMPLALSDHAGDIDIHINNDSATINPLADKEFAGRETIRLDTLDALHASGDIPAVDLIKIDVDGHEPAILVGASAYLRKHQPVIIIEFANWCLELTGSSVEKLKAQLNELGYVLYSERTGHAFANRGEFMYECANWDHAVNVWAVPTALAQTLTSLDRLRLGRPAAP